EDLANPIIHNFFTEHARDHAKLWWHHNSENKGKKANDGMILRLPIEEAIDTDALTDLNKMRLLYAFPRASDSIQRMEIMGIVGALDDQNIFFPYPHA